MNSNISLESAGLSAEKERALICWELRDLIWMKIAKFKIYSSPWKPKGIPSSLKVPIAMFSIKPSNVEKQAHSVPMLTVIMAPSRAINWVIPFVIHAFILALNVRMMPYAQHAQKPEELTVESVSVEIRHCMMNSLNFNARIAFFHFARNVREKVYALLALMSTILSSMKYSTVVNVGQDSIKWKQECFHELLLIRLVKYVLLNAYSVEI